MAKLLNALVILSLLVSSLPPANVTASTRPPDAVSAGRSANPTAAKSSDAWSPSLAKPAQVPTPSQADGSIQILLTDSGFQPDVITITVGSRVTWFNATTEPRALQGGNPSYTTFLPFVSSDSSQRVPSILPTPVPTRRANNWPTSGDAIFSTMLLPNDSFTYTFVSVGTFSYFIANNPQFKGQVVVISPTVTPTATKATTPTKTSIAIASGTATRTRTWTPRVTASATSTQTPTRTPLLGAICAQVYGDLNENGVRDIDEPLLSGVVIAVKNSSDVVVGTATTKLTELTCFPKLPPGAYQVTETNLAGYTSTTADLVAATVTSGSSVVVEFGDEPSTTSEPRVVPSTEWVNFYGLHVFIDGELAPVGTRVLALNPRGVLAGGFDITELGKYGLMPVYRDESQTAQDEGLRPNETITFTVNGRQANVLGPDQPIWTANGDLKRADLAVGNPPASYRVDTVSLPPVPTVTPQPRSGPRAVQSGTTDLIPLRPGWNLVSFPITPANQDAAAVLAPVWGLFSVVLSYDQGGLSYYPNLPASMNTLRTMDATHGYWIKMNSAGTLAVSGARSAENQSITLSAGWNLVSYLPRGAQNVPAALASINGQFSSVLGYDQGGLSYYPTLPPDLNTLKALDLNHGYWIKMNNGATLTYPNAPQTATPVPTETPFLTLPASPTPVPTSTATPTLAARVSPVYPPAVISSNTTWRTTDGTYVINNTVTVNQGITLTVEPGTVIKFNPNTGLVVNGTLIADGTSSALIVFTSIKDDSYAGDTNSDGTMSTPGAGDWGTLYFGPTSTGSRLSYARVTYAGSWNCGSVYCQPANLYISGSSPAVDNVNVEYGTSYGVLLANSANPTFSNSRIAHIGGTGVRINSSSAPMLQSNLIESNSGYAIFMEASAAPRYSGNRALNNGTNGVGVNGTIAPSVTWDSDLPYVIDGGLAINPGISLILQPGAILKFKDYSQNLTVNGTLRATGVITNPIVFTSLKDDTVGGDTNNDGSASRPAPGDWGGITFSNSSTNSLLDYGTVRYAGGSSANITISGSAPTISHSQIANSSNYGIKLTNVAMPTISDSTIADNNSDGLNMASSSMPTLTNNGFVDNAAYAIRMDATCSFNASGNTVSNNMYNGVGVSGAVPANTTWQANLPYIIDGGVTVNTGIILTIQPGVVVKFKDQNQNLIVNGTLRANGTSGNMITFTGLNDTMATGGMRTAERLSQQALEANLAPGDWGRIEFASTSSASQFSYVVVRYGGYGSYGSVYLNGSAPSISNSIISYSSGNGLYISGSSPTISNNVFTANGNAGIYATTLANPIIHSNQVYSNTQYGLYNNSSGVTIDATNNWWGSASGPTHSSNPSGTGDRVTNGVNFSPWQTSPAQPTPTPYATPSPTPVPNYVGGTISVPTTWTLANSPYVVNNDVTINNGVILTIQPGVVVKFQSGRRIVVNGTLAASGTFSNTIVFTSDKDDAYAGDTNSDGTATRPAPGNWGGITLNATANASTLAYVLLRYAATAIQITGSSPTISNATIMFGSSSAISVSSAGAPTIQNSVLRENQGAGITLSGSSPLIQGNVFASNGDAAITMDGNSLPDNSNNQAYYNKYNGIKVNGTVGTRGAWHNDLPYVIGIDGYSDVTVDTGVVLTIEPGAIVKLGNGQGLTVNGGLVANGTITDHITFTSIQNDAVGGDTNGNGSQSWAAPGDWSLIHFTASSLGSSSLTYSDVTYGGVQVTGAAPTIANNLIAYANGYGLRVLSLGAPSIQNNIIRNNLSNGLQLESSSSPSIQNNQFISNQGYAVYMDASSTPTFIGNTATDNRTNGVGVSGNASASTTWNANLTYVIEGVSINSGVSLTLEPGAVVKFASYASMTANGNLLAVGTSANKITFTSLKDDTVGGDTNNDATASTPAAGDWYYIQFNSSSTASKVDQATVRYGGNYYYYNPSASLYLNGVAFPIQNTAISASRYYGLHIKDASPAITNVEISAAETAIYLENAHPTISNSSIHDNTNYGIRGTGSNPTITGSTISNSKQGLYLYSTSAPYPSISGNTFANNIIYAASIEAGALPTFGANTFVGTVGNGINVGAGTLTQNATMYGGGVYVIGKITVEQGTTLTIRPGAIVKAFGRDYCYGSCAGIVVKGALNAIGQPANQIVFTSTRDDGSGGDTNGDGTQTAPAVWDWAGIHFGPTSSTSTIEQAIIKYAGTGIYDGTSYFYGAVSVNNSSPIIRSSTLQNNGSYGIYLTGASPTITGTVIADQSYGIYARSSSFPTITGNTISSSSVGVYLDDSSRGSISETAFVANPTAIDLKTDALPSVGANTEVNSTGNAINVRDGTIPSNTTLYPGIVYRLGQTIVNAGVVLTAQPGTIVKFAPSVYYYSGGSLLMRGRLVAQGTSSQKVVFTSGYDDTYGGDTNNDGANTTPGPGNWQAIYLSTNDSIIDYTVVKYGGAMTVDDTYYNGMLNLNNVSPSISNSTIARGSGNGIQVINATPNINNNDIWGNGTGIYAQNGARPSIHNNNIHDNSSYGVYNADTTLVVDATNNSWGHDSGPAPIGAGNAVNFTDAWVNSQLVRTYWVAFDPWNGKTNWIEQNLGVLKQWIAYAAEPVNTATGNYTYNYQDLSIPGRGLSLAFQRFYNSQSNYQGPLGYGWTCSYCLNIREDSGNALLMNEDGRVDKYVPDGSGGYTPPKGVYDVLTKSGSTFTLKRKDQTIYSFNGSGKLSGITDRNNNTITLGYSGNNLTSITDPTGRSLTLSYDASNRITQIADPASRTIRFAYDGFSNLVSATDARNNTTAYAYDSKHRLLTITDPNNHIFVTNIYDADGRVTTQRDARLNNTTFNYDIYSKVTTVTDPLNHATTYTYDSELRLQSERDAAGQTISYGYDASSNRNRLTDRRGNITRYLYDTVGNTTVITDALSGVTTMTYDGMNNLTSQTDPLGRTASHTYDAKGNLIRTSDSLGNSTTFAYNANGLMTSTTDARNNTTSFGYDGNGNQTLITDALGKTKTLTYDAVGRKLSERDALNHTTAYTYDANNNVLAVTDAAGNVTTYTYDVVGNRLTATDALTHVATYAYNEKDKLLSVTNALGGVSRYAYDANDNKISETDPLTHTTTLTYDAVNRLTQVTNPSSQTTRYGYDVDGNRTGVTDANGKTTNFVFDALNRVTQVTDPLLNTTTYILDAVGNKLRVIDASGNTTHYQYDSLNRLTRVTDALSGIVQYTYDQVGNKTSMVDANNHTTTYTYDALNRLTRVTDPLSNHVDYGYDFVGNSTSVTNAREQTTGFTYNNLYRLTLVTYPDSTTVTYSYDAVGNRTQMVDTTGTTTYTYDALNRVMNITNPGSRVVGYGYDAAGNRTAVTYPDGKTVTFTFDSANRLTRVADWSNRQTSYTYDNAGNLTGQTNPNNTSVSLTYDAANRLSGLINTSTVSGTIASYSYTMDKVGNRTRVVDAEGTTNLEYDKLYRLTAVTYPDLKNTVYQYDAMGNRTVMTTTLGATSYSYDAADRLLSAGSTSFTWDADGNMLSKGGMTFTYNGVNRLTQVVSGTLTVGFTYDGDGRRATKTVNSTATNYTFDTIAGLAYVLTEQTGTDTTLYTYGNDLVAMTDPASIQSYYYYDGLGSSRALANSSGQVTARYSYDVFGAVRSSSGSSSNDFTFTGEQSDDEIGLIYLRARYYDPSVGRFLSPDSRHGNERIPQTINRYVYVANNPVNQIDPTGEFLESLTEKWHNITYNVAHPGEYIEGMKQALSDPIARGFVLDELSENSKIVGYGSCAVGFGPGCSFFLGAAKVIDAANAADTARGVLSGEVPQDVAVHRAFRIGTSLVLGKALDAVAGPAGEQAWRLGTRGLGTKVGGMLGQATFGTLGELLTHSGASRRISNPAADQFVNLLNRLDQSNGASPTATHDIIPSYYAQIVPQLQRSGFDAAHPQPPPSHSK